MDNEASSFEMSETLAAFVASTPLLEESWRLCHVANTTSPGSFVVDDNHRVGSGLTFLAFSGIQMVTWSDDSYLVPLDNQLFYPLDRQFQGGKEEEVRVHAGMLDLFLQFYHSPTFKTQMSAILSKNKTIIITGHSLGATTASLTTMWLLSYLQSHSSSVSVLCITFGSLLLGNESLSRAILRERWAGNFCHVAANHDVVPRLLLVPVVSSSPQLHFLLQLWHLSMESPDFFPVQVSDEEKAQLFSFVSNHIGLRTFWPFGNYLFCSGEGAICVDDAAAITKMMHLLFLTGSPTSAIEDHLKYGHYAKKISLQFLYQRSSMGSGESISESNYEVGISLALQSCGITSQASVICPAKGCLTMAKRVGYTPNLNSANLAIRLSKITRYRAEIEWYKASCDRSDNQLGYYDSFKRRGASKREAKVNMNRFKLGRFWDNVIDMLDNNELPHDFHRRAKWVNASQFYKLLIEPLDIADYYRTGVNRLNGHYINHGRPRRYKIFDKWWNDRTIGETDQGNKRTKYASLTQDTCFWARVEEAREWLADARSENDGAKLALLWDNLVNFELYAGSLVESMEVSKDVVAKNSSYSLWVKEWEELKSH